MSWHADRQTLVRYAENRIDEATAFSLEAHLPACSSCRDVLASLADRHRLGRVWNEIADRVDRPPASGFERLLRALGVADHAARLLAATPSLRLSWVVAVAVGLGFAVLAARSVGDGVLVFLVVAPLVPTAGVAIAYGPGIDPVYEVGLASPIGGFRLLLIRTTAVLLSSIVLAGVAALGLPDVGWTAAAWLLPSLALTLLTLAASTATSPHAAVAIVASVWVMGVAAVEKVAVAELAAFGAGAQVVFTVVAVAAAGVIAARRDALEVRVRV